MHGRLPVLQACSFPLLRAVSPASGKSKNSGAGDTAVLASIHTRDQSRPKMSATRWYTSPMLRRWLIRGLALMILTVCLVAWGVSHWREIYVSRNSKTTLALGLNSGRVIIPVCCGSSLSV